MTQPGGSYLYLSQFRPAEILTNEPAGSIAYAVLGGVGSPTLLSIGSTGQVLTVSSAGVPSWQAPPSASLTTGYVGYGVASVLGGTSDLQFENSDGSSTLTIGDGTTNTNQGILQGPNGIGIVIKGGHSNGNTTNASLSLTSSSDVSGNSGAGNAMLAGGYAQGAAQGGNVTIDAGGGSTPGTTNFTIAGTTYMSLSTGGLFITGGSSNGGTLSYLNMDQISGDPSFTITATGITLVTNSDPVVIRSTQIALASPASTSADGNIYVGSGSGGSGSITINSTTSYLELIGASALVLGVGSPGTPVGLQMNTTGALGIGAASADFGTIGQLLTSNGSVQPPSWSTPSVTINTSSGLTGGGTLSLGDTINLALDPTYTPTFAEITITGTPTNATDVATKGYVDGVANGISWKNEVQYATTANITLSGEQTIDGYGTSASRILVKNQTDQTQNGIYTSDPGAWTRTTDASTGPELVGAAVFVTLGSQAGTAWTQTTGGSIVIGTTNITFVQFGAPGGYSAGYGLSLAGNTFNNAGVLTVAGTTNQIIVSGGTGGTGNLTLSLPQNIDTSAAPTFAGTNFTSIPNAALVHSTLTVAPGVGMSGGGAVALGGTITLDNAGVTSLAGTANQIVASASTGGVTLSLAPSAYISTALQIGGGVPGPSSPNGATFQTGSGSSGFAIYSSSIATQSSSNYSVGFDGSNTSVNGTANVYLGISGTPIATVSSGGLNVTGAVLATQIGVNASVSGLVAGDIIVSRNSVSGAIYFATTANFIFFDTNTYHFSGGSITCTGGFVGNASSATTATTATNIAGGTAGEIPFQSASGTTAFSSKLVWTDSAGTLTLNPGATSKIALGTSDYILDDGTGNMAINATQNLYLYGPNIYLTPGSGTHFIFSSGGDLNIAGSSGAAGQVLTSQGVGAHPTWTTPSTPNMVAVTSAYTASVNDYIIADTSGSAFTITLPASPVFGQRVYFVDGAGTWSTNSLTVNGNGANISGSSANMVVNLSHENFSLVYYNSTQGWIVGL